MKLNVANVCSTIWLALLVMAWSLPVRAEENIAPTVKGMQFKIGLICSHPAPALDLIRVAHNEQMFTTYFIGYSAISGLCTQGNVGSFTLVHKWKTINVSYDGYKAEMWEVKMEDDTQMWAIILPDVLTHRTGTAI